MVALHRKAETSWNCSFTLLPGITLIKSKAGATWYILQPKTRNNHAQFSSVTSVNNLELILSKVRVTTLNFTGTYPVKILAWPWKYHVTFALENRQNHVSKALHSKFFIKAKDGDSCQSQVVSRLTFAFEGNAFYRTYLIFIHSITKKLRRCC